MGSGGAVQVRGRILTRIRVYPGMPRAAVDALIFGRLGLLFWWNAVLTVVVALTLAGLAWR